MVPRERVARLVPDGIELDVFDGLTPVSILTYRHGGFGPALLGPLRRLLPSPAQSNWRLNMPREAVFFLKNVIDHPLHVIGARTLSDGLPAHLPERMTHERRGDVVETRITPGSGSAPDLAATVRETEDRSLPAAFERLGGGWDAAVAYLVPQGRAVRTHPAVGLCSESLIIVDPSAIRAAEVVAIESSWLGPITEGCEPFAFVIPEVRFASTDERWAPLRAA